MAPHKGMDGPLYFCGGGGGVDEIPIWPQLSFLKGMNAKVGLQN